MSDALTSALTGSTTTYTITLDLARPLMTSNDQRRAKWPAIAEAKRKTAELVAWQARVQLPRGLRLERVIVRATWYVDNNRARDSDSLGPFLKAALDALTDKRAKGGRLISRGLLPDDNSKYVVESRQRVVVDRNSPPRITIELEDLSPHPVLAS